MSTTIKSRMRALREALDALDHDLASLPAALPLGWPNLNLQMLCAAIAFQRQVMLSYDGSLRRIEPHCIRETNSGRLLLYATRLNDYDPGRELRSYRIDRIEDVDVTERPFDGPEERDN